MKYNLSKLHVMGILTIKFQLYELKYPTEKLEYNQQLSAVVKQ
jgi:hypothetical protein